jgi:hypothetical protein
MRNGGHAGYACFTIRLRIWEAGVRTFSGELFKSSIYKGSPGWIRKFLSNYCIILCFSKFDPLDTPFSSVQEFVDSLRAKCRTSVKGVYFQWNVLR